MPLPPNTALTLRARLSAPAGTALARVPVVANALVLSESEGPPQVIELGRGVPAPDGALLIPVTHERIVGAEFHSRIQLAVLPPRVRIPRVIAEIPARPRGASIDFGVIEVRPEALFSIGDTEFFGFSKVVIDRLGAAVPPDVAELQRRLDALNDQIRQLSAQLATLTTRNTELEQANARFRSDLETAGRERTAAQESAAAAARQLEALNGQVARLNAEKAELETQVATLTAQNGQMQRANNRLRTEIETANRDLAAARESAATAAKQLEELNGQIARLTGEKNRVEAELAALNVQTAELRQSNARLQSDLEMAGRERAAAVESAAAFQKQAETLNGQVGQLNSRMLQLNSQILQLNDQVSTVESQSRALAAERQTLQRVNTDLSAELKTVIEERTAAQTAVDGLKESINTRSSLGDLVENVGTQLRSAQETLAGSGSPFRLGRLSMELKVMPSQHGTAFNFPTRDEVQRIAGNSLSVLTVDFGAAVPTVVPVDPSLTEVPDLGGATEIMARRMLAAAGLGLQTGFLAVPRAEEGFSQAGRVVKQIPAARERVAPGSVVTVLLGKEE